jgi:hypothetical protein
LARIGSGRYFADLPPTTDSAEVWADVLVLVVELGIGFIGLKLLTSLLRREKQESLFPKKKPLAELRSFARKTIGFVLVLVATALFVDALHRLPQTGSAELTGYIMGATALPVIMGYVGTKMMLRGDLRATPS